MLTVNTPAAAATLTTTLSTKGQVVIPKTVRDALAWPDGMTLAIEPHAQGVLLSAAKRYFPLSDPDKLLGCVNYKGPALSLDEIDKKLATAFAENWKKDNP
jgi:AbrB family looped-hinge helix DNA binding protein